MLWLWAHRYEGRVTRPLVARKGRVYFIEAAGTLRVKIGFTSGDPRQRARKLQTACPFPLRVLASFAGTTVDEADLHERFAASRAVEGTEWFHITADVRDFIATIVAPVAEDRGVVNGVVKPAHPPAPHWALTDY